MPENKLSKTVKISELGNKILEVVQSQGGSDVSFDCVIRNVDNTHTANYFLSMLHLVNNGHIDIMTENTDIFTASTYSNIKIKLCSSKNWCIKSKTKRHTYFFMLSLFIAFLKAPNHLHEFW